MQYLGFVKLYRKILDSEIKSFGAGGLGFMSYCLLKANHTDQQWYDGAKYVDIKAL
jgi:beta-mannanase